MRHAWGAIRERLGLRSSVATSDQETRNTDVPVVPPTTTATANPVTPVSLPDTRELMLAEMTRAFNVGFGLGGGLGSGNNSRVEGESTGLSDTNNSNTSNSGIPALATLPPEGSFDRFLMDLQIDLRTALTQVEHLPTSPGTPTPRDVQSTPSEPQQTEGTNGDGSSSETQRAGDQQSPEGIHAVDHERSSVPDLLEMYDTDSEFGDAEEDSDDDGKLHSHTFFTLSRNGIQLFS